MTATIPPEERARWLRWATNVSVALAPSKLVAWWLSGSVSVLASMMHQDPTGGSVRPPPPPPSQHYPDAATSATRAGDA